jgi:hypothetical protein
MARSIRKNATPKPQLLADIIIDRRAPHATFLEKRELSQLPDAIAIENAVQSFRHDGCEEVLWEVLLSYDYSYSEIAAIAANPGAGLHGSGYGWPVGYEQRIA